MGEQVRRAGIRAVTQTRATTWKEVEVLIFFFFFWILCFRRQTVLFRNNHQAFAKELNPIPFRIVIKPSGSAGSDNVACCKNMEQLRTMFHRILGWYRAFAPSSRFFTANSVCSDTKEKPMFWD